jgi:hypothetical protein
MNIYDSFIAFKDFVTAALGASIRRSLTHWEPLETGNKNTAIFLPDKNTVDKTFNHAVIIWISVFDKDADKIAETQMNIAQQLFNAIQGANITGIVTQALTDIEYFDPTSQAPNIGLLRVSVNLTLDYIDDCN